MMDYLEEKVHDIKTPELNNLETYVSSHNRFNYYMVLGFTDLGRTQINKMPFRDSQHQEIEISMSST